MKTGKVSPGNVPQVRKQKAAIMVRQHIGPPLGFQGHLGFDISFSLYKTGPHVLLQAQYVAKEVLLIFQSLGSRMLSAQTQFVDQLPWRMRG